MYVFERQRAKTTHGYEFYASFNPDPPWVNSEGYSYPVERKNGHEICNILLRWAVDFAPKFRASLIITLKIVLRDKSIEYLQFPK